jgi:hypothetical protein
VVRRPRLRSALLVAAVLTAGVPTVVLADAPALHCGVKQSGSWETIHVDAFKPVQALASPDTVSTWTVDEDRPQDLAVTNGVRVQSSSDHGCDWADSLVLSVTPSGGQTFAGASAKIVSLALLGSTHVAAVQEGTGAASRPHIMVGTGGSWVTADSGLPAQGAPKLLRAGNDGRTLYLTVSPTGSGGDTSGGTTGLPGGLPVGGSGGGVSSQTGLLYGSTDRGHTWSLRTTANDLPSGGTGFTALDVDSSDSNRLYGIVGGRLAVSSDGGGTFQTTADTDFTSLTAMGPLTVVAFRSAGQAYYSGNGGGSFNSYRAPGGITSVGYRDGDQTLMIERTGVLQRLSLFSGQTAPAPAGVEPRTGSLTGDRSGQSSFHALAGHSLLRYVDPVGKGIVIPPVAAGDTSVPPPIPGTVVPRVQNITLPVGNAGTASFTLDLPKNPTPLDLFFLVDASGSMTDYIDNLKANINRIVDSLKAQHVDLRVGVGTLGSGPRDGEKPYPLTYAYPPDPNNPKAPPRKYNRPVIYHLIRPVGDTGPNLKKAVDSLTIESDDINPYLGGGGHEGQLLALSQVVTGKGIQTRAQKGTNLYEVAPGQDAHFRPSQAVRRIVILASDEAFDDPYPQAHTADNRPIFTQSLADLRAARVQVIGLSAGDPDSLPDLRHVASGTHSVAPPGGVHCGIDPNTDVPENIAAGQPLVCNSGDHFADAIIRLLASLVDRQSVKLVPVAKSPVLGALQGSALLGLNVKKPNAAPFTVNVSCVGVKPGRYGGDIAAVLRGTKVGSAHVNVTCVKAQAAAPPKPLPPIGNPPAPVPNPAGPPVLPPPPPAPAVQVQVQTQVQVNPMTAGALQEQQELQLALALNGTLKDDDPAFNPGVADMAMVDRRKREHVQALYLLAFAMTTCAGLGLARLRTKPEVRVRRAS